VENFVESDTDSSETFNEVPKLFLLLLRLDQLQHCAPAEFLFIEV